MSVTEEIKSRLDIVNFLSQYMQLKKAGRNYTGLCPFHAEKTPSFVVFPDSQNWRCFGACGEGGDIFNFVMKHDGLDFVSTLKMLADRAGVTLQERSPEQANQDEHVVKLRGLLDETAKFFHDRLLNSPDAKHARAYVAKRGLKAKTLAEFKIGFAPNDWHQAIDHLKSLGYTEADILEAGVASRNEEKDRVYDRFRNRLMIPICDARGQVIGFGARALAADDNPKYLNSPQTPLFDKSAALFGLHMARRTIRESETAVIVEGYMDAIQAHQAGFSNVVAQMGTAFTEPQLRQLSKYARRLILALDPDAAGVKATMRGLEVARKVSGASEIFPDGIGMMRSASKLDVELLVITVPDGKDPDDLIRENPAAWGTLVEAAQPVVDYVIEVGTAHLTAKSSFGDREAVARELLPILLATENDLQQHYNVQRLALKLHLDEVKLIGWAQQHRPSSRVILTEKRKLPVPTPTVSPSSQPPTVESAPPDIPHGSAMERLCLSLLIRQPRLWSLANRKLRELAVQKPAVHRSGMQQPALGPLNAEDFSNSDCRAIINLLAQALAQDDMEPVDYLEHHLPDDLRLEVERLLSNPVAAYRHQITERMLSTVMLERDRNLITEIVINNLDEALVWLLNLRKQRLSRENQDLFFLLTEADLEAGIPYQKQVSINNLSINIIDKGIREIVQAQRVLS